MLCHMTCSLWVPVLSDSMHSTSDGLDAELLPTHHRNPEPCHPRHDVSHLPESHAILKCQDVSNNSKSTSYISVVGCDLLKGSEWFIQGC